MVRLLILLFGLVVFGGHANAGSTQEAKYFEVAFAVAHGGSTPLHHTAIVEVGKRARMAVTPQNPTEPAVRLDYTVEGIGLTDAGSPIVKLSGTSFSRAAGTSWAMNQEFSAQVYPGKKALLQVRAKSGSERSVEIEVRPLTEAAVRARFGGEIPVAKTCPDELAQTASPKEYCPEWPCPDWGGGEERCCSRPCGDDSGNTLTCCNVIRCCACNVCCAPKQ